MKNYQGKSDSRGGDFRGGDRGSKPSFQKKSWGNNRGSDREDVVMHKATCSECKKMCEVPFRPTGEKPVFCRDCFAGKREGDSRPSGRDFENRAPKSWTDRPSPAPRQEFSRPSYTAPAQASHSSVDESMKRQLADISGKLDKLVAVIEKMSQTVAVAKVETTPAAVKEVAVESESPEKKVVKKVATKKVAEKKVVTKKTIAKKTK